MQIKNIKNSSSRGNRTQLVAVVIKVIEAIKILDVVLTLSKLQLTQVHFLIRDTQADLIIQPLISSVLVKLLDKGLIIIIGLAHSLNIKYYSLILLENLRNSCHSCG